MQRRFRQRWRENIDAYILIGPWLFGLITLTAIPMIGSAALSLTQWNLLTPAKFTGFANFGTLVQDQLFWLSLGNSGYYVLFSVPLQLLVALIAALAVNVRLRISNVYRTLLYLPSITPSVASALLWAWIFNPDFGLVNAILTALHLPTSQWIADPAMAKPALIIMSLWSIGPQMIIFLAGLRGIPDTLYEAAAVDGAGWWSRFIHVTLPMLSPIIFFSLIVGVIGSFQIFNAAYIMTQGGLANATLFYVLYLYNKAWQSLQMGYASALARVLFLIIMLITLIQFRVGRLWVFYEGELRS